jgi:hypothetical protein
LTYPLQSHYGLGVDSTSNRNEYQESSCGGKERPARKADNLPAIYEPILYTMCGPRQLTSIMPPRSVTEIALLAEGKRTFDFGGLNDTYVAVNGGKRRQT